MLILICPLCYVFVPWSTKLSFPTSMLAGLCCTSRLSWMNLCLFLFLVEAGSHIMHSFLLISFTVLLHIPFDFLITAIPIFWVYFFTKAICKVNCGCIAVSVRYDHIGLGNSATCNRVGVCLKEQNDTLLPQYSYLAADGSDCHFPLLAHFSTSTCYVER